MNKFLPLLFFVVSISAEVTPTVKNDTPQTSYVPSATAYQGNNDATAVREYFDLFSIFFLLHSVKKIFLLCLLFFSGCRF